MGWPRSLNLKVSQARRFYGVYFVEVIPAAGMAFLSADLVRVCVGAMVFNVVILVLPLAFLVRLTSDRALLGDLATPARRRPSCGWSSPGCLSQASLGMIQYLT